MQERRLDRGLLLTMGETDTVELEAGRVSIRPAWRWLLEPEEGGPDEPTAAARRTDPPTG